MTTNCNRSLRLQNPTYFPNALFFFSPPVPNSLAECSCLAKYISPSVFCPLLCSGLAEFLLALQLYFPPSNPPSPRVCAGHLLQRELKAFLCQPCHHGLFNNYPNKVDNEDCDATPPRPPPPSPPLSLKQRGPPHPSPSGLMNGPIRHASCPGGEQAAPARQTGHQARGRKWSRAERDGAGVACQNSHQAKRPQKRRVEIWRNAGRAAETGRGTGYTSKRGANLDASNAVGQRG